MRVIKFNAFSQAFNDFKNSDEMRNTNPQIRKVISTILDSELAYFLPILEAQSFEIEDTNNDI